MKELIEWRSEFPILDNTVYMISHSLGAMPRRTRDRLQEYADMWATRGIRSWEEAWWMMPTNVGDMIGRIIGAGDGEVVLHQNVSMCQSIILSCLDFSGRRNKIVSESFNFPSNLYVYSAQRTGARLVSVESEDGVTVPLDRMLEAIDEQTALVSVSHVIYRSAFIQNLEAITKRAHEVGALVVADVYQSAGTVPLDVRALGLDFVTGGSVKWLCGGPGAGYLYVRRDLWPKLEPQLTGWLAHREPFSFEQPPIEYAETIYRFLNGTPSIPGIYAAMSGYEIVNEVGVERIRAKSIAQTTRLIEIAEDAGFKVNVPKKSDERGGTVVVDVPHGQQVTQELLRRDFLVDYRPGAGVRIAPHFYSKDEELELTIREIRSILDTRAYEQHTAALAQ
jgi:kynureninase